jgi:hypothetical protein
LGVVTVILFVKGWLEFFLNRFAPCTSTLILPL